MENITYYTTLRLLHFIGMAAWFGTALAVTIIWSKKQTEDVDLVFDLITKVEMPASFFIPLTGLNELYFIELSTTIISILIFDILYKRLTLLRHLIKLLFLL